MASERRNDIGNKMTVLLIGALLGIIMTITWYTARDAIGLAHANEVNITVLQSQYAGMCDDLKEIKTDVRKLLQGDTWKRRSSNVN